MKGARIALEGPVETLERGGKLGIEHIHKCRCAVCILPMQNGARIDLGLDLLLGVGHRVGKKKPHRRKGALTDPPLGVVQEINRLGVELQVQRLERRADVLKVVANGLLGGGYLLADGVLGPP